MAAYANKYVSTLNVSEDGGREREENVTIIGD